MKLRIELSKSLMSAQAQVHTVLYVVGLPTVAVGQRTTDYQCLVTQMWLFFDVLKKNVELRKQLGNAGCGSVSSVPTVTRLSKEACSRPPNAGSGSSAMKWKWLQHILCKDFFEIS